MQLYLRNKKKNKTTKLENRNRHGFGVFQIQTKNIKKNNSAYSTLIYNKIKI